MLVPPLFRTVDPDVPHGHLFARRMQNGNDQRADAVGREDVAAVAVALLAIVLMQIDHGPAAEQLGIITDISQIGGRKNHGTNGFTITGKRERAPESAKDDGLRLPLPPEGGSPFRAARNSRGFPDGNGPRPGYFPVRGSLPNRSISPRSTLRNISASAATTGEMRSITSRM